MGTLISLLSIAGAICCIGVYFLLERGVLTSHGKAYYFWNAVGTLFVLIGVVYTFGEGDVGAIIQEFCWLSISVLGCLRGLRGGDRKPE